MSKKELLEFYKKRKDFISSKTTGEIDFTDVFDPYLDEKKERPVMIVGEAPGENEVLRKAPFVGKAGENLNYLISLSGLDRKKDFLITNAFPFRTLSGNKNRTPKASELKMGAELLKKEIDLVKPKIILLLGNSAIKAFSYIEPEVKKLKKCGFYEINSQKYGVCYHPSPIAFNRKDIREALEKFFLKLGEIHG